MAADGLKLAGTARRSPTEVSFIDTVVGCHDAMLMKVVVGTPDTERA
jgi:hypothetical protein